MSTKTKTAWFLSVSAACAIGWFAAMQVVRGPAFRSEEDAYERFALAFTTTDSMDRVDALSRLIRKLTPETLPGAVRAFKDSQRDVFNSDLRMLMWYWAKEDPRGMLTEVQTWPEVRSQRIAAGEAVYWLLKKEGYDSARALFDQLPSHQREQALSYLVLAYIESGETVNLIELIDSYDSRDERDFVAGIVVGRILAANGPEELVRWVESLPDGPGTSNDLKAVAFRAAESELLRRDHFEFLESWLDEIGDARWAAGGGRRTMGVHLAKRDPRRAIEWAQSLPPEKDRDRVLGETLRTYASFDRDGALAWIRTQEPSASLDPGAARLVYEYMDRNPEASLEMLARIQDPDTFDKARKMVAHHWRGVAHDVREKAMKKLEAIPRPAGPAAPSAPEPSGAAS